jgi:hypothetical protein
MCQTVDEDIHDTMLIIHTATARPDPSRSTPHPTSTRRLAPRPQAPCTTAKVPQGMRCSSRPVGRGKIARARKHQGGGACCSRQRPRQLLSTAEQLERAGRQLTCQARAQRQKSRRARGSRSGEGGRSGAGRPLSARQPRRQRPRLQQAHERLLERRATAQAPGGRGGSAHGCGRPMGGGGGRPCMPWARPRPQGHFKLRPGCAMAV